MRRFLLSLTLAVSLSALYASPALAKRHGRTSKSAPEGAQKAPLYGPNPALSCAGAAPTPLTFGFAILDTPGDETTLSGVVSLKGAAPNATFIVFPTQGPLGPVCGPLVGSEVFLHTNARGNGTVHFSAERIPGTTTFFVQLFNQAPPSEAFASPAVVLD
jgi:hypothetical protein